MLNLNQLRVFHAVATIKSFTRAADAVAVTQATLNARLRSDLASWSWAAFTSYAVGTVVMLMVIFVQRAPRPSLTMAAAVPWWAWTGGCLGAAYVVLSIVLLRRLGASTVVAFVVAGQMLERWRSISSDLWG